MSNTNLHCASHHFRDIADHWGVACLQCTHLEWTPEFRIVKFCLKKMHIILWCGAKHISISRTIQDSWVWQIDR